MTPGGSSERSRTALVTGGSRGIGRAVVERLIADGLSVVFSYARDDDAAAAVTATPRADHLLLDAVRCDLGEPGSGRRLYDTADERLGGLDVLINNAGSATVPRPLGETTDADYDAIMTVNTRAVFELMREASTRLRDGGRIVNISTVNTVRPTASVAVHAASKAAVEQFAACAAHDLGPRGITVNAVSPGATDTDLLHGNNPGVDVAAVVAPMTPLGRLGRPDDIAAVVSFLVGDGGRWVTGQTIRAGGGL